MHKLKVELIKYKWIFAIGIVVAIVMGLLAANLHIISFMSYRSKGDTQNIIQLLERDINHKERQKDWYFKEGIQYLLKDGSEEGLIFLEKNLEQFILERQYDIIAGYNTKQLLFKDQNLFIQILMKDVSQEACQSYLKRIDSTQLDAALFYYFGSQTKIDSAFIDQLVVILKSYPHRLPLDKFQFNLYEILLLDEVDKGEQKNLIFSKLEGEKARELLFKEMKTKPLDLETLKNWVELLHNNHILQPEEYTSFNSIYSEIQLARNGQKELEVKEVDLNNQKETIDLQIGDQLKTVEKNEKSISELKTQIMAIESQLENLTDYVHLSLYIEKTYGNGDYEASLPRKSIFNNYKASSQKYILKLSTTEFYQEGVYYVDAYLKGTKVNNKGNEYPYYTEVSQSELASIATLQQELEVQTNEMNKLNSETQSLKGALEVLKEELGYEQNQKELIALAKQRQELAKKLDEKIVEIKNLFGIGTIHLFADHLNTD